MDRANRQISRKVIAVVAASFATMALAGCAAEKQFHPAYLSDDSRVVGGGVLIEWKAPEPGTAYLVEKGTGKLVQTVSLDSGQTYEFAVKSVVEAQDLENLIGTDVREAEFLLYFKPSPAEE